MNEPEEHADQSPPEYEPPDKVDIVDAPSWRVTERPERKLGIWWALLTVVVAGWCVAMAVLINKRIGILDPDLSPGYALLLLHSVYASIFVFIVACMLRVRGLSLRKVLTLHKPRRKLDIWWALLIWGLVQVWWFYGLNLDIPWWEFYSANISNGQITMLNRLVYVSVVVLIVFGMLKLLGLQAKDSLALHRPQRAPFLDAMLVLLLLIALDLFLHETVGLTRERDAWRMNLVHDPGSWFFLLAGACILPAVSKEIIMRGVLFSGIRNTIRSERWGKIVAIGLPGVMLGSMMLLMNLSKWIVVQNFDLEYLGIPPYYAPWHTIAMATLMPIVFGLGREMTNSLYTPIIMSTVWHAVALIRVAAMGVS